MSSKEPLARTNGGLRIADGVGVSGRSMQLDVLRGLAILLVLFRHPVVPPGAAGHLRPLLGWTERFGWTGVDLFFVLSGFLIGGLLFAEIRDEGRLRLGRFLVRRALRIWPAYFAFLGFAIILSVEAHGGLWAGAKPLLPNLVHLQNYLGTPEIHTWSLAVEEHFYVVLPLVLLLLLRLNKLSWIPVLLLLVCFGCLGLRLANPNHSFSFETHLTPTHLRLDSLGFGVLLAYGYQFRPGVFSWVPRYRIPLLVAGIALLSPMLMIDIERRFVGTIGFTLTYLGYGCILIACLGAEHDIVGRALRSRTARVIAFVGFYSYSIYLWHVVVFRNLIHYSISIHGPIRWLVLMPLYVLLATLLGVVTAKLVEQPLLRYRDRRFPARPRKIGSASSSVGPVSAGPVAAVPSAS